MIIIITIIIIILYSPVSLLNQQRFITVNDKENLVTLKSLKKRNT